MKNDGLYLFLVLFFIYVQSGTDARKGSLGITHSIDDPGIPPVGYPYDVTSSDIYKTQYLN
jgi:hypothetical protein